VLALGLVRPHHGLPENIAAGPVHADHGPVHALVGQEPRTLWQQKHGAPGCSSPVIVDDRLYLVTDRGLFSCYAVESGKLIWTQGLRGRHLASLVAGDGKLYALSTKGRTTVIDLNQQETVLARNELPGKSHTTPALAPGCIVLRIGEFLYCIEGEA